MAVTVEQCCRAGADLTGWAWRQGFPELSPALAVASAAIDGARLGQQYRVTHYRLLEVVVVGRQWRGMGLGSKLVHTVQVSLESQPNHIPFN